MGNKYELYCCGSRGSRPVEGKRFNEFGGFTSCYVLKGEDYALIIDCGTGLYEANNIILDCSKVDIVMTHMHYDHILGLLDWDTLNRKSDITFYSGFQNWQGEKTFDEFFREPFWPVQPHFNLQEAPPFGEQLQLKNDLSIEFFPSPHPNEAQRVMIRMTNDDGSQHKIVVMFDNENAEGIDRELLMNADYIIYDGMFTDAEYDDRRGYGHSTWQEACRLAVKVNCGKMLITHHSPFRTDEELRHFEKLAREIYPSTDFARSGQHWEFPFVPQEEKKAEQSEKKAVFSFFSSFNERLSELLTDKQKLPRIMGLGVYIILGLVALFMTIVNIFTDKTLLMYSTLVFFILCSINTILELKFRKLHETVLTLFQLELMALLTFFIISGTPEGFSAIWALMLPLGGMLILGKRRTTALCAIMLLILLFFFETDIGRSYLFYDYTESFMLRFPMAFAAFFALAYFLEVIRERLTGELEKLRESQAEIIATQTAELRGQYFDIVRANSQLQLRNKILNNMIGDDISDEKLREMMNVSDDSEGSEG